MHENRTFILLEELQDGTIVEVTCKGSWLLRDNCYLKWPILIPPLKLSTNHKEIRFSEWLESMRKDVECTFGILKQRFRILKSGIRVHSMEVADDVFKT